MPWTRVFTDRTEFDKACKLAGKKLRGLAFREALAEALLQIMEKDERVFVFGEGVDDPKGIFGTTLNLHKKFGTQRSFDIPIAENTMTGVGIGAALAGLRPVMVHMRMDFMLLAMDQIINHASKWSYMFGGKVTVPLVIRTLIGRGWGSAAQHSQSIQGLFMHVPGLKIVMPSTPRDAKGLLVASIEDDNPVIFIEHRLLYEHIGCVPEDLYSIPLGKANVKKEGKDVTVVAVSYMVFESVKAAEKLKEEGIDVEVIDVRTVKPLDNETIFNSVKKTGRLVIADTGWITGGVAAEISARVSSNIFESLKSPILRVCCPDVPTPASPNLEKAFYPGKEEIINTVKRILK